MENEQILFCTLFSKVKSNVAYYTSHELILSLDIPYYKGTRWRFKIDFKAQQNPANLYFGTTELTLGNLRLPSDENTTFSTYAAFDRARKIVRPPGWRSRFCYRCFI
jgi:hypothetical protein